MPAQGIFGSPPNRRRFWRRPVLAKLGLSDEAARSTVAKDGGLEIGPLENLPIIKDLAADMQPFFDKWQRAKGAFVPSRTRNDEIEGIRPDSAARIAADAAIECINCGICYAACDTVRWNSDYLGPAALNRAWTLVNDVRDGANAVRLQAVAASGARPP